MKLSPLCELKKSDIQKHEKKILKIVSNPLYICMKCARVASEKEYLCDAQKIKS